jgi:hypothetical protein
MLPAILSINEICPICGEGYVVRCKCPLCCMNCINKHEWHLCVIHNNIVIGPADHSLPTNQCRCGINNTNTVPVESVQQNPYSVSEVDRIRGEGI